ncbi:MAG: PD40 domain-containing protein [Chloroflexi bacterium]|nr:PD40 domain-containing protein [Chloroflexota bacterium]
MRLHRLPLIAVLCLLLALFACSPASPAQNTLHVFRFSPPALIELSDDFQPVAELPLSFPPDCGLFDIFPAPRGILFAVELSCAYGQTVLFLDLETGSLSPAFTEADSHFLAWTNDGKAVFLKVNSTGNPQIQRAYADGTHDFVPVTELTYDLAPKPNGSDFTFTFSRGLGFGSEMWLAKKDGNIVQQVYADKENYIAYACWSPDGRQIAFIKIPDSQVPFTVGELWLMNANGSNARKLADADAGHGYAANWSPDGMQIAFVVRENADDTRANESADALVSNIYVVGVAANEITQVTHFDEGRAETPHWSPDGNKLFFQYVINGRMDSQVVDLLKDEIKPVLTESACCPSWMRK